jgi:hypothetical protein
MVATGNPAGCVSRDSDLNVHIRLTAMTEPAASQPPVPEGGGLFDPFMMPHLLRLTDAIERLTDDMVARDAGVFRSGRANIRYVVERQLYFAVVEDRQLYDYFVAHERGQPLPDVNTMTHWAREITPYLRNARPAPGEPLDRKTRLLRWLHHRHGRGSVQIEKCDGGRPRVLFLVIHPKFVRYLKPIAERLSRPFAFLAIEDPAMFDVLREQDLPRVHIELTAETQAMTLPEVEIFHEKFKPGLFDDWFIRLNAVRRALKVLHPDCIVVPEGNAAIYELANQSAKPIGISTVCIQQGWAPVMHPGFRNMNYASMCVWGEAFADMLQTRNPDQHFVVTGNHVVFGRPQGDVSERNALAFFLQNGAYWLTEQAWRRMLDLIVWTAKRFPDREIRVREHPGAPLTEAELLRLNEAPNIRQMSPGPFSLEDVFSGCRVAIAITSTTILEAVASGIVPLILDVGGFGPYSPDIAATGAAIEVNNYQDARRELERLVDDDRFCASFGPRLADARKRLFARNGEQALDAIVAEIQRSGR